MNLHAVLPVGVVPTHRGGSCGGCDYDETCSSGTCKSECAACVDTHCGWQQSDCQSNYECMALLNCATSCGSNSCIQSCIDFHSGGADDLMSLLQCMDDSCSYQC